MIGPLMLRFGLMASRLVRGPALPTLAASGGYYVAVGAPWYRRDGAERVGRMELRSGRSGALLAELFGDEADCWFGWHIRRAPDPDGRGRPALLVASLRHPVEGRAAVGVLDLYVLRADESAPAKEP